MPNCQFRKYFASKAFSRDSLPGGFLSVTFLPFTHNIPSLLTNVKEAIQRENPYIGFLQHTHPSFRERATHS